METLDEKRERRRQYLRERRERLKAEGRCQWCAAGLQEADGDLCVECTQKHAESYQRYRARHIEKVRERERNQSREYRKARAEQIAAKVRAVRAERKLAGLCLTCGQPAIEDDNECKRHRDLRRKRGREYLRRKREGLPPPPRRVRTKRTRSPRVNRGVRDVLAYIPLDERLDTPRIRILRAMRWLEWTSVRDLFDLLGVAYLAEDQREWEAHMAQMSRMVKRGELERRGKLNAYEYKLTDKGRAESDRFRFGDLTPRHPRKAA